MPDSATANRVGARLAACGAVACALGLAVVWLAFARVSPAKTWDAAALKGFIVLGRSATQALGLGSIDVVIYAPFAVATVLVAVRDGRIRMALAVPVLLLGPVASSEALKPLLAHSHPALKPFHLTTASYPSGNATVAMAMALCAVLVTPGRARAVVAGAGGVFTAGVGLSLLSLGSHLPSDVMGGFLVAGAWAWGAAAVLLWTDERRPAGGGRPVREAWARRRPGLPLWSVPAIVLGGTALVLALAVGFRSHHRPHGLAEQTGSLVAAGAVIAILAAALVSGFAAFAERHHWR